MTRHLGDIIREFREKAGFSLRELSRQSNVDISSLSRLESHQQYLLTPENLRRVAQALGTTAPELERLAGNASQPKMPRDWPTLEQWLQRDRFLTAAQKDAILRVYQSYVHPRGER